MTEDTILAVASPPGRSVRGIVRISGPGALELLRPHAGWGRPEKADPGRGVHRTRLDLGERTIPCLAIVFIAPASYTGEDGVELLLPGNPILLERVISMLLRSADDRGVAARRAEPGEFTSRAFMTGRISLAGAEGVAATIAARCDAQLQAAHHLGTGRVAETARALADELADALALVEAGIDFTDQEDVVPVGPAVLHESLSSVRDALRSTLDRAVGMESLEAVPWVVLAGAPNAGKSTLFNALLGHPRAVVSDLAGTTRDVIAEPMSLTGEAGGAEVMLVDVAGADTARGDLDHAMQTRAREAIERAELILRCVPVEGDTSTEATLPPDTLLVRTMADRAGSGGEPSSGADATVSALDGTGLDDLRALVAIRMEARAVSLAADALVLQPRHEAAFARTRDDLDEAIRLLTPHRADRVLPDPELVAAAMRSALDELAIVAGDVTPDDVLGRLFSTFCVGK